VTGFPRISDPIRSCYRQVKAELIMLANASTPTQVDGSHDFDFLIGDWKAHIRRLPERLKGSKVWVEYDGISNNKKPSRQQR
jgi:hypothetical protein